VLRFRQLAAAEVAREREAGREEVARVRECARQVLQKSSRLIVKEPYQRAVQKFSVNRERARPKSRTKVFC